MSAPESNPNEWEFRLFGRVLFRLPRRVAYLIILGLSIGVGLKSPDEARKFAEGAVQKLFLELHEWRALLDGLTKRTSPSGERRRGPLALPTPREGGTGDSGDQVSVSQSPPDSGELIWRGKRIAPAMCYADAERLHGHPLPLREAPCSTSAKRRSVAPGTGAIRLTGRHTYCWKHGVWWTWAEVLYQDEVLWAARYYLRCFR